MTVETVVKLGGSLCREPNLRELLRQLSDVSPSPLIVPGGGPFADMVRKTCGVLEPGPDAEHWMAILAMDQYAELLQALCPHSEIARDPSELAGLLRAGKLPILAPFSWLRARDPLPHDWDVTSDSISAWVAAELGARRLVLLKSVEGVMAPEGLFEEVPVEAAADLGFVDIYFKEACPKNLECWIVSGEYPERVVELLRSGRTRGTRLAS